MVESEQVWSGIFVAKDSTGALSTPSVGPVGVLYVNGAVNAATVTVTGANPYTWSVTLPELNDEDSVSMYITATIAGVATGSVVAQELVEAVEQTTASGPFYATVSTLKARLDITDTEDDAALEAVLLAVGRWIEQYTGRVFTVPSADATRYFTAEEGDCIWPGDLVSVTNIYTDEDGDRTYERTWAATDYDLLPANAAAFSEPYTKVQVTPMGTRVFPTLTNGVKIVGQWGWPETPQPIVEATLLQSARLWKRSDAVFGVAGVSELGQLFVVPRLDPDVMLLLGPYRAWRGRRV